MIRDLPTLYRGSVKNVLGPVSSGSENLAVFEYSDAYSVFDWGRMPDALDQKGEALAVLAADLFEKLERPETWREFSRSPEAQAIRKANRFGSAFNDMGETLQKSGLLTHYRGLGWPAKRIDPARGDQQHENAMVQFPPSNILAVQQVAVIKPEVVPVLGRALSDYHTTRAAPLPRLIPLEVVFRFSCPPGSSLFERAAQDPDYMAGIGFGHCEVHAGAKWDFPVLELFTKLESTDRPVSLSEALAISGLPAAQLQEMLLLTAWVAAYLKALCSRAGVELADGKLEWALSGSGVEKGKCMLVDAIGPDELRLLRNGVQLSKEFLRTHYRGTSWYQALGQAKQEARAQGISDWKRLVTVPVPHLPSQKQILASQLYLSLTNALTGREWFAHAWPIDQVAREIAAAGETVP